VFRVMLVMYVRCVSVPATRPRGSYKVSWLLKGAGQASDASLLRSWKLVEARLALCFGHCCCRERIGTTTSETIARHVMQD
jgi:hypothetical protein